MDMLLGGIKKLGKKKKKKNLENRESNTKKKKKKGGWDELPLKLFKQTKQGRHKGV